jgi:hypothetical protein
MKRIGYDADTTRYYFRDQDGSVWQGAEGSEYGEMTRGVEYFHEPLDGLPFELLDSRQTTFICST